MLAVFVFVLPIWILLSTRYIVDSDTLKVRAGPFFWNLPVSDIHSLSPTRSPLSSPALSLDRIQINYGAGKRLIVSPDDRRGFADALGLELDEGGDSEQG